ncbi:hypothetical protein ACIRJR_03285 [Streptomyces sp. NPDC102402]|uniref:SCO4402 family protein n=1 Tax=Streptomyces sp. NPDC102402 TaxID=3366169 RepID=UPI0038216E87
MTNRSGRWAGPHWNLVSVVPLGALVIVADNAITQVLAVLALVLAAARYGRESATRSRQDGARSAKSAGPPGGTSPEVLCARTVQVGAGLDPNGGAPAVPGPAGRPVDEDGQRLANFRVNLVPAVLALANPPWQQAVWLDPSRFENVDHIFHVLFDDFCDADRPEGYLGISLRTPEEVDLMRRLGRALTAAEAGALDDTDDAYLRSAAWPEVVAAAGCLAEVMVSNDLSELVTLHSAGTEGRPGPHEPTGGSA